MVEITLSSWNVYLGLAITSFFTGLGSAMGTWLFHHIRERVARKRKKKIKS